MAVSLAFWKERTHNLSRMSLGDLVKAFFTYPAVLVYLALAALGAGLALRWVEAWWSIAVAAAVGMTVLYVLDRLCLMIYRARFKRGLHTHAAIDAFIRRFISRRNINLALFTVGYVVGLGVEAFYLIVLWQAATLAYHAGRTAWILGVERAAPGRPAAGPAGR